MQLRTHQIEAANFLAKQLADDGFMRFVAPLGVGRSAIVTEAMKLSGKRCAYVAGIRELREQFKGISERLGSPMDVLDLRADLSQYDIVFAECREWQAKKLHHPHVVFLG